MDITLKNKTKKKHTGAVVRIRKKKKKAHRELRSGSSFRKKPGVDDGCTIMFIPQLERRIRLWRESLRRSAQRTTTKYGREKDKAAAIIHRNVPWLSGGMARRVRNSRPIKMPSPTYTIDKPLTSEP